MKNNKLSDIVFNYKFIISIIIVSFIIGYSFESYQKPLSLFLIIIDFIYIYAINELENNYEKKNQK